jgi:hypothetical protein
MIYKLSENLYWKLGRNNSEVINYINSVFMLKQKVIGLIILN